MTLRIALLVLFLAVPGCWQSHDTPPGGDAGTEADVPAAPDAPPDSGACPAGEDYFVPGCGSGEDVTIEPGCYRPCEGPTDATCPTGLACRRTVVNPCICPPGGACCGACGAEQWLCLEPAPTGPCEGRSYCDCTDGCEPLIDLTHGCVCPCDEPFRCGGPPCDCACGGATYLGCAPVGACAETEVTCPSDTTGALDPICPACVGGV